MQTRTLNERYRLDQIIGEGGMAVVYRGYDLYLDRIVAIKILRDQYGRDDNFLRRFEREAQAAARLAHPHIANVYDVGRDGETRYIVMEYVNGPNLKELIRRQGPFSVDGASFVLRQVAEALDFAHAHGIVHRDIKPQNILVDENGAAKVVDFGIAKGLSDANLTDTGTGMGTVHYVSPEQARGERATPLSDVYATGVVLFEMLTKELPFDADTPVGVAMQHVSAEPPSPREFNPALPPEVEPIVLQALAKDPVDRFPSAGALAAALEHWDSSPTHALASQATRMAAGAAPTTAMRPRPHPRPRAVAVPARGGRGAVPPGRAIPLRDDVGCVTWIIGATIMLGLLGLVILGYRLGDFSFFDPSPTSVPVTQLPTQAAVVATTATPTPNPTTVPTATPTLPIVLATPTATPIATPLPTPTPTVAPTPTPEVTPTVAPAPTPETATVPVLTNSTVDQAKAAAKVGDFQLREQDQFNDTVQQGYIFDQDPKAGTKLARGGPITIWVSKGPQFVTIPDVKGLPYLEAKGQLEALGLTVSEVEEASASVDEGLVIKAEPSDQIAPGGTVVLHVSAGNKVLVPDLSGRPYQQAVQTLKQAGLVVDGVVPQSCALLKSSDPKFDCDNFPNGGVVSATLPWNTWVDKGSHISIAYYDAKPK
ncbi:MAG TPA: protein kinase [Thermomicrobiaceae bacterium]|nr:protein kinase [Thermomicrobiaceae bacterium]